MPTGETPKVCTLSESFMKPSSKTMENEKQIHYFGDQIDVTSVVDSDKEEDQLLPSDVHVFSASSTLHGLSHMFASHHSTLRRFAWTVAFLTSLTLLLLQSSNRAAYYLSFPHVTRLDEVTAGDLVFPVVTICNMNEFKFNEITKRDMFHVGQLLGILDDEDKLIKPSFYHNIENMDEGPTKERMMKLKRRMDELTNFEGYNVKANEKFDMHDFYTRTSHNISQFLLACTYRGTTCNHTWFTEEEKDGEEELKPSDFKFFASNSTFHGISHVFTGDNVTLRKALWAIAFFTSLSLFLIQAYDRYAYYLTRPHITKLDEQEASIITFPTVTICNMNPFRLSTLTTDDYFYVGQELLNLFNSDYSLKSNGFKDNRTWPMVAEKINRILRDGKAFRPQSKELNMFEFYNRTGHTLNGMVKSCKYRGDPCPDGYWVPVYTRYGKCYMFNSEEKKPLLKTLKGGVDNGLEILLDTEQDDYMPVWAETDEISVEAGFKVQIHVQWEPPFIHELGFGIAPGFQTLVATQEQRITFLPEPHGSCEAGANKSRHYHFDKYTISACRITCETEFVVNTCGCRMIHMPGNASYCSPESYQKCADKTLDYLVDADEKICVCGTPCDVTRYNLETSSLQLPSTQALSYMAYKYKKTEEYVKNNFVKLNIFFEALNYETIDQKKAYEIPGLFGDIGGQMGLFIGASILTVLELIDYIYEVIKVKTWGKKARKNGNAASEKNQRQNAKEIEMMNYPPQPQGNRMEDGRMITNKAPYVAYNHLTPLQEYENHTYPFVDPRPNESNELNYRMPTTNPQTLGSTLFNLKDDRMNEKEMEAYMGQRVNLPPPMRSRGGQNTSLSYSDLYRMPENNWSSGDNPSNLASPRFAASNATAPHNSGYLESATTPVSSGSYFRQRGGFPMSNGTQKGSKPVRSSPTRTGPIDFQDYPISIETDIN